MTREELEAAIWQALTRMANLGQDPRDTVTEILKAADSYGLAEFGVAAQRRRQALAEVVGDASYGGIAGAS